MAKKKEKGNTMKEDPDSPLDAGIRRYVHLLSDNGVETFESCEGGKGHSYPEPTIAFHGERAAGFHALAIAIENALPVYSIRRTWSIIDGEPTGPHWEMTFCKKAA